MLPLGARGAATEDYEARSGAVAASRRQPRRGAAMGALRCLRMTALAAELDFAFARLSQLVSPAERTRETDEGVETQYLRPAPEFRVGSSWCSAFPGVKFCLEVSGLNRDRLRNCQA